MSSKIIDGLRKKADEGHDIWVLIEGLDILTRHNERQKVLREKWVKLSVVESELRGVFADIKKMLIVLRSLTPKNSEGEVVLNKWIEKYSDKEDTKPRLE